ncbi:OmpA family protein [Methylosinus sporium]|uniref:OmpA family protein n=1 Tax=Methylosinus sporium TaxID=428 RepID=UPI00383A1B37
MSRRKNLLLAGLMTPSLALGPQAGLAPATAAETLQLAQGAPQGFEPNHEKRPPAQRPAQPAPAPRPAPAAPPAFHPAPAQHAPSAPPPAPYPGAGAPPTPRPQLRAAPPAPPAPAIIHPPQQAAPIRQAPPPHPIAAPAAIPTPHPIAPANPAAAHSPSPAIPHESPAPAAGRPPAPALSGDHGAGAGAPAARIPPAAPIVTPAIGQQPAPTVPAPPAHSAAPPVGGGQGLPPNGANGAPAHLGGPQSAPAAGGAPETPAPHGQPPAGAPAQGGGFLPSTAQPGAAPRPNGPPPGGVPAGDHAGAPPAGAGAGGRFLPPGQQGAVPPGAPPGAGAPQHVPPQAGGAAYGVLPAGGPPPSGAAYGAPPAGGGPRVSPAAAAAIGAAAGLVGGFVLSQPGAHRLDDVHARRQQFERDGVLVVQEPGRTIVREGGGAFIRHDENERFRDLGGNLRSERHGEEYVSVYARRDGGEVLTYTDANGVLLRRLRRFPDGREIILIDNGFRGPPRGYAEEVVVLPPPPVEIAPDAYVVDYGAADERLVYETLTAPPLAPMPRRYTLDEIRYSPSVRAYTRSVDIDTINFDTGSWAITPDQAQRLVTVAEALNEAIKRNPAEVFLIEGHTDAVGSDVDNLSLSDRRAQAVATILSRDFGVPPENLTTQGYGEQYLKVQTQGPSRENRRVTVRRITPLLGGPQAETHRR